MKARPYLISIFFFVLAYNAFSQQQVPYRKDITFPFVLRNVRVDVAPVFDTVGLLKMLNHIHAVTKAHTARNEVYFHSGDTLTEYDLNELEQYLRNSELFSKTDIHVIPVGDSDEANDGLPEADLWIVTKDAFSIKGSASLSKAGDQTSAAVSAREVNFIGLGLQLGFGLDYTTINNRGLRLTGLFADPNIEGSHLSAGIGGGISKIERSAYAYLEKPFYSDRVSTAFHVDGSVFKGEDFFHVLNYENNTYSTTTNALGGYGWYGWSNARPGNVFIGMLSLGFNHTLRDSFGLNPRAFDNSVSAFGALNSVQRRFVYMKNADFRGDRFIPIGGMGHISLGKISPIAGGRDNLLYLGAEARQSVQSGPLYGFAQAAAGTGLAGKDARYTLEHITASGLLTINPGALAMKIDQTNVWNWPAYIAQPLDNSSGLRGYDYFGMFAANKLVINTEYRLFPVVKISIFELGTAVFYDIGAVWNQSEHLADTRFHSSAGGGIRIANAMGTFNKALLRIDLAYNFDQKKIGKIIIGSSESFDVFGALESRPPGPYTPQ